MATAAARDQEPKAAEVRKLPATSESETPQAAWSALTRLAEAALSGKLGRAGPGVIAAILTSVLVSGGLWGLHTVSGDRALADRLEAQETALKDRLDEQDARIGRRLNEHEERIRRMASQQDRVLFALESIATAVGARIPPLREPNRSR